MDYTFNELVDMKRIGELINPFYKATGIGIAILDLNGHVIAASEGKHLFTGLHQHNSDSKRVGYESEPNFIDSLLVNGERYTIYHRGKGLIDASAPIVVQNKLIAVLLTSQLLREKPQLNDTKQVKKNAICGPLYRNDWPDVSVIEDQQLKYMLNFFSRSVAFLAEMGLKEYKQKQAQQELQAAKEELNISQKILMAAFEELREQHERV